MLIEVRSPRALVGQLLIDEQGVTLRIDDLRRTGFYAEVRLDLDTLMDLDYEIRALGRFDGEPTGCEFCPLADVGCSVCQALSECLTAGERNEGGIL